MSSLRRHPIVYALVLLVFQFQIAFAQTTAISVAVDKPGHEIPATLFGLFFEDINFGADGGLYPERVKNRSFEFPDPLMSWKKSGSDASVEVRTDSPINENNSHYLRLSNGAGITNEGFRGMGVQRAGAYVFSIYARQPNQSAPAGLRMNLVSEDGKVVGSARVMRVSTAWKKYSVAVRPTATSLKAQLNIAVTGDGPIDVDMVSLMPQNTWRNRPNGLRPDLVSTLR